MPLFWIVHGATWRLLRIQESRVIISARLNAMTDGLKGSYVEAARAFGCRGHRVA
jgi:hypothetical protein